MTSERPHYRTPYHQAWDVIERHPGCGGTVRLAKLILSLYNDEFAYSVRECLDGLDDELTQLACRMVAYYAGRGENQDLRDIGEKVFKRHPDLAAEGAAGHQAKMDYHERRYARAATL